MDKTDGVIITPALPEHEAQVKALAELCLGQGDYEPEWYAPGPYAKEFNVAIDGGAVVGYNYNYLTRLDQALASMKISQNDIAPGHTMAAVLKSMGIQPGLRQQGLGLRLLQTAIPRLFQDGAELLIASAWRMGDKVPMHSIFKELGLTYLFDVERPWYDQGIVCPYCRTVYCTCNSAIYIKWRNAHE